jgi:regulator of protease activity HflC (stomatin/prohibitin superfamily)
MNEFHLSPAILIGLLVTISAFFSVTVTKEGQVGVVVLFGKYRRMLRPGLSFRIPFVETIYRRLSLQHRSVELEFQAITLDQANVDFKALIIYGVQNDEVETIKRAAFKFIDERSFMQSLVRSVEGSIRAFVATKKQSEILVLRKDIVDEVNLNIKHELNDWGYHLYNLQINDISFDEAIVRSMAQVVATNNMKAAAENEAQAQFISKTRVAEAEAHSKRVIAEAECDVERLRGEGNARLRKEMALGFTDAATIIEGSGVEPAAMHFEMWLDAMKQVAAQSHGNILSFDGSMEGFEKTMRQMSLLGKVDKVVPTELHTN